FLSFFVDDFLLGVSGGWARALAVVAGHREALQAFGVRPNMAKMQTCPASEGVDFIGFRIRAVDAKWVLSPTAEAEHRIIERIEAVTRHVAGIPSDDRASTLIRRLDPH